LGSTERRRSRTYPATGYAASPVLKTGWATGPVPLRGQRTLLRYPRRVADYFLVARVRGPAWDHGRARREQLGWDEHAAFMDALVAEGFVVLGGPVGEGDGQEALLVVDAAGEAEVRARLAGDPWGEDMLVTESVRPWRVWLGALAR